MRGGRKNGSRSSQPVTNKRVRPAAEKRAREIAEIAELEARIAAEVPPSSSSPSALESVASLSSAYTDGFGKKATKEDKEESNRAIGGGGTSASLFSDLPLSRLTQIGLSKSSFSSLTQIQRTAIPLALAGRDVLGAARTGSGKTLAFVVPVIERLYRARWAAGDGLAAIVISPTRELAAQIFDVFKSVSSQHYSFSAGLLTGGKDFEEEASAIPTLSVLVCTPGRLLQHLEQTASLDCSQLLMLVLDEADRLLDLGFADTLNSILKYLPPQRQTLLFSATQTRSVRDLARLSLSPRPEYVSVHDKQADAMATPARLSQHYIICNLQDKLSLLFSFIRTHLKSKTIVFLSSCKQSRFVFEVFRRLRPGVPLQLLHGKMRQERRSLVYYDFCQKPECVLFATDVAARGLDFPGIDWVVQLDCPEDSETYIHRVGRTARFRSAGHALLVLLPSEAPAFVPLLTSAKVPISETRIATSSAVSITGKIAAEVAADTELKEMAQKAMSSYVRSVLLQTNKSVFKASELPVNEYGESLGLAIVPKLKKMLNTAAARSTSSSKDALSDTLVLRAESNKLKNANKSLMRLKAKIAEEKAEKKKKKSKEVEEEEDNDEDEDDENDDDDDDEITEKRVLANDDDDNDDDDDDEEVFIRKNEQGPGHHPSHNSDDDDSKLEIPDLSHLTDHERARVHRIMRDTVAIGAASSTAGGLLSGNKATAGAGKSRSTPFEKIVAEKRKKEGSEVSLPLTKDAILAAAAAHTAKVAARLALTSARDKEIEKVRVRDMKRAAKKRNRDVEEVEEEEEEDGEEVEEEEEEEKVMNVSEKKEISTESLEETAIRLMKKKKI
jgi:ATP-dependent RNA helicase DDX10/DBP4